jgi:hypothetical protein
MSDSVYMAQWYCLAPSPKVSPLSSYRTCGCILKYSNSQQWTATLTLPPSVNVLIWNGRKYCMQCGLWHSNEALPVHSCFQNIIWFHDTLGNVILFTPIRNVLPFFLQFLQNSVVPDIGLILCRPLILKFIQIRGGGDILRMNINVFMLLSNVCTDFHESHNYSMKFCGNIPFWNAHKREKNLKYRKISQTSSVKPLHSLCWLPWNSQLIQVFHRNFLYRLLQKSLMKCGM